MFRKYILLSLTTLLLTAAAFSCRVRLEQTALADRLIRLHVVAASDAPADQARKLKVRDALLPRIAELTAACADAGAAEAALRAALPELARLAAGTLATGEPALASLEREAFPRRDYGSFSLPAGRYRALRVTLGAGEGHNWWCVAFPALCLPAAAGEEADVFSEAAVAAGLSDGEIELMSAETPSVQLKFRILDWLAAVFAP